MRKLILTFFKKKQGAVAVEFALVVPILTALTAGIYDLTQLTLLHQRIDRFAAFVGSATSFRSPKLSDVNSAIDSMNNIQALFSQLNTPFALDMSKGTVIISNIVNTSPYKNSFDPNDLKITWQKKNNSLYTSNIGGTFTVPKNIPSLSLIQDQEVIVVEVFYTYTPLFRINFINSIYNIYKYIVFPIKGASMGYLYGVP